MGKSGAGDWPADGHREPEQISRRDFLKAAGVAALSLGAETAPPGADPSKPFVFSPEDNGLLDEIQEQTLKYFWDFGHPASGMARERSNGIEAYDTDVVTTGGTGFGIMAMVVGVQREWLPRADTVKRITRIVDFLSRPETDKFHGVFPHWLDGKTGKAVPFSPMDDGADLVETSFLMMGLLCARQYFQGKTSEEKDLREKINQLWEAVDWQWHTRDGSNNLYWHWSPNHAWQKNMPISGWNECLVTHVLAASAPKPEHRVPPEVYHHGWARHGAMKNGRSYHGTPLPLGPDGGGPLFFTQYSFMGLDPRGLKDAYADYWEQNCNHARINYEHCVKNPRRHKGYGPNSWGLTASDDGDEGYAVHSPTEDSGVISPTAAAATLPYLPKESLAALRRFREDERIWRKDGYGFVDAFNADKGWYAKTYLAIDEGPIVGMIENARTQLLWNLFMSCDEVKQGLKTLGFKSQLHLESPDPVVSPFIENIRLAPQGFEHRP